MKLAVLWGGRMSGSSKLDESRNQPSPDLLDLWAMDPRAVLVTATGGTTLGDAQLGRQKALRAIMAAASLPTLGQWAKEVSHPEAGWERGWPPFFLQDVVNELGDRICRSVKAGAYKGGADGFWEADEGLHVVVEVKTSLAISVDLPRLEGQRCKRQAEIGADGPACTALVVVGRNAAEVDTLAQAIRGTPREATTCVISVGGLLKLVGLLQYKAPSARQSAAAAMLRPQPYGALDALVEHMGMSLINLPDAEIPEPNPTLQVEWATTDDAKRARALHRAQRLLGKTLKLRDGIYGSEDGTVAVAVALSNFHDPTYQFSFAKKKVARLQNESDQAWLVLACDSEGIVLLPLERVHGADASPSGVSITVLAEQGVPVIAKGVGDLRDVYWPYLEG